jgi:spoIIIJ-associated protein
MSKGKDFYGKDIAEVIEQACAAFAVPREDLDIEVLETGSAGIFGLCKKKAHIRVQRRAVSLTAEVEEAAAVPVLSIEEATPLAENERKASTQPSLTAQSAEPMPTEAETVRQETPSLSVSDVEPDHPTPSEGSGEEQEAESDEFEEEDTVEPPTAESLSAIQEDLHRLLTLMGLPSEVQVVFEDNTVLCNITGPYEEQIVGPEGRTLDSLQYLLRKMVARHLADRIMLALNAGDFRERRTEELKIRALELAAQVKADGKTQAIPALNPSERRVVHMVLQDDKSIRSRSVGEGLFKKVLIYKPGKGRRSVPKKRRGGQGGRSSGD